MANAQKRVQRNNDELKQFFMGDLDALAANGNEVAKTAKKKITRSETKPVNFLIDHSVFSFLMSQRVITELERKEEQGEFFKASSLSNEAKECVLFMQAMAEKAGVNNIRKYIDTLIEADLAKTQESSVNKTDFD